MNRGKCQEIIDAFKERATHYQSIQQERDLTIEELQDMKKEYLNFTKGLLQALNDQERQDIDLDGVKRIFRNSGLRKEELSDDELDELIQSAAESQPDYLEQIYARLDSIDRTLTDYVKRQEERHQELTSRLDQLSAVEGTEYDVTCRRITIQPSIEIITKVK